MAQLTGVRANWVISAAFGDHRRARGRGRHPLHLPHRRGRARHRPGAALRRLRRRRDRRSRQPRAAPLSAVSSWASIINVLQATLPITLKSHTQLFAFLVRDRDPRPAVPNGLVSIRGGAVERLWRRVRRSPAPAERRGVTALRRAESAARIVWPPFALCAFLRRHVGARRRLRRRRLQGHGRQACS